MLPIFSVSASHILCKLAWLLRCSDDNELALQRLISVPRAYQRCGMIVTDFQQFLPVKDGEGYVIKNQSVLPSIALERVTLRTCDGV